MAQEILGALRNLNRELGVTILIVTHDPRIASEVDRVIAIRDGRTSTETTRQVLSPLIEAEDDENGLNGQDLGHEVMYEELVVLDAAGRLQIPRDYLEELRIGDRARVELTDEGILVRPVAGREAVASRTSEEDEWEVQVSGLYVEEQDEPPPPHHKRVFDWLRNRLSSSKTQQGEG
jgi:ABC-type multidrug transport system ATPase subunit